MSNRLQLYMLQPVKRIGFRNGGRKLFNTSRSRFLAEEARYATIPPPPPPPNMFIERARAIVLTGFILVLGWVALGDRTPDWADKPVPAMEKALGVPEKGIEGKSQD